MRESRSGEAPAAPSSLAALLVVLVAAAAAAAVFLWITTREPDGYAPPEQRPAPGAEGLRPIETH